jgi:F-type H+-transporting ATPase subunit alpha
MPLVHNNHNNNSNKSAARAAAPVLASNASRSFATASQVIELSNYLESRISATSSESASQYAEVGKVISVGDGIARVYGLNNVQAGEMVVFNSG